MSEAFSIFAAAREAGARVALRVGDAAYRYADMAELAAQRLAALRAEPAFAAAAAPWPLVAANTLDTLVTLYALLEARVPVQLLHSKLTAVERDRETAATAQALRTPGALPADAAAILYTSGTTGAPRGAVLTRAALLASAQASGANLGWQDDDCWLLAMPVARVGGLSIVTRCLAARRTVALAPPFDAARLPQWIDAQRATLLSLVPTMLALALDAQPDWRAPSHLRALLLGGAAASPRLLARAAQRRLPIVITYGCTETCSQVVVTPYAQRFDPAGSGAGRPLPGVELRVDDGRILVRGPMRMAGYLGEPPLDPAAWFDTGDLGALDADGQLHLHARRSDLIVSGGDNVYPLEVERVLEDAPGVAAAAVFGVPDETWGQLVAAALVTDERWPGDEALADHLVERLASPKRPRRLVRVQALPVTPAGKPDRAALAALIPALRPLRYRH